MARSSRKRRWGAADLPFLLGDPIGRRQLAQGVGTLCWPVLWRIAALHRRTLARQARVAVVVGSYGKTTTARAVAAALGLPVEAVDGENAYATRARALTRLRGRSHAVLEVGIDAPGQMATYGRMIRPDIAIATSIGSEHWHGLGSLEDTRREKAAMIEALPASGLAVLNGDDPNTRWMAGRTHARVRTFGFGEDCDVRAHDVALDWPRGTHFKVEVDGRDLEVRIRLFGPKMILPVLAGLAVALAEGRSVEESLTAIAALEPTPGRLQPVVLDDGAIVLRDDYKSGPETIEVALDLLAEIPAPRRFVLMGDVTEPEGKQGPVYGAIGERIAKIADRAIFFGQNAQRYAAGAARGGMPREQMTKLRYEFDEAIAILERELAPGDVVLLKGRSNQKLGRIALALQGRRVRCRLKSCRVGIACGRCPRLDRGWQDDPPAGLA